MVDRETHLEINWQHEVHKDFWEEYLDKHGFKCKQDFHDLQDISVK